MTTQSYSKNYTIEDIDREKFLIIHMDDMGMSYAANRAGMELFQKGIANSASLMMPCAWAHDFIKWCNKNPQYDVGIHLTHTCEWDVARWRPLADEKDVPGMLDADGFMWSGVNKEIMNVPPAQVEIEMRRQIMQAQAWGFKPTHFDSHMCVHHEAGDLLKIYIDLAAEYDVIPNIPDWVAYSDETSEIWTGLECTIPLVRWVSSGEGSDYEQKKTSFHDALRNVEPGLNIVTCHPVVDTPEIRTVIPNWKNRYFEYLMLMDDEILDIINQQGIRLTTWKEMHDIVSKAELVLEV